MDTILKLVAVAAMMAPPLGLVVWASRRRVTKAKPLPNPLTPAAARLARYEALRIADDEDHLRRELIGRELIRAINVRPHAPALTRAATLAAPPAREAATEPPVSPTVVPIHGRRYG